MPRDPAKPHWGFQPQPAIPRFLAKVERDAEHGCWLWVGTVTSQNGYGRFGMGVALGGRSEWAHRASWILFRGPIPKGMELDHLCRVRACVNPDHLEPVTRRVNAQRAVRARLNGHCYRGHLFTPENTIRTSRGRHCRTCDNEYQRMFRRGERRLHPLDRRNREEIIAYIDPIREQSGETVVGLIDPGSTA